MQQNGTSMGIRLVYIAGLLALAGSSAAAQTLSRPILYYYLMPGVGFVPVYAASAAPAARASAPSTATYGAPASATGQPGYYTEDYPGAKEEKPDQKLPAHIRVRLPTSAEVTVNDKKTTSTGPVREYETPELDPERVYTYLVKAKWIEDGITVEKSVKVRALAGNRVTINFVPPARERPRPQPVARASETAERRLPPAAEPPLPPVPSPPSAQWRAPYP